MSEELIIEHCSPTLAGIKAGSMFSVRVTEDTDINNEVVGIIISAVIYLFLYPLAAA